MSCVFERTAGEGDGVRHGAVDYILDTGGESGGADGADLVGFGRPGLEVVGRGGGHEVEVGYPG